MPIATCQSFCLCHRASRVLAVFYFVVYIGSGTPGATRVIAGGAAMALTAIVVYISTLQVSIQQELSLRAQRSHSCGLLFPIAVNLEADRASGQRGARPPVAVKPELMMQVLPRACEQFVSCCAVLSDDFRFSRARGGRRVGWR